MTRKDYELIAAALAAASPKGCESEDAVDTWERICVLMAEALRQDNPRFDSARFFDACAK